MTLSVTDDDLDDLDDRAALGAVLVHQGGVVGAPTARGARPPGGRHHCVPARAGLSDAPARLDEFDVVVSDDELPEAEADLLRDAGVELVQAPGRS